MKFWILVLIPHTGQGSGGKCQVTADSWLQNEAKRLIEVVFHCVPLQSNPGLPWSIGEGLPHLAFKSWQIRLAKSGFIQGMQIYKSIKTSDKALT